MTKDFMKTVYHSSEYFAFNFLADYKEIISNFDETPTSNNFSISTLAESEHSTSVVYHLSILERSKLCVLKNENLKSSEEILCKFKQELLLVMLSWHTYYISMLSDHFKIRISENKSLSSHGFIKIQLGEIISKISHLKNIIHLPELFSYAIRVIKEIGLDLHKISGARSFLEGNITEMIILFEIFKKIYF